jgi:proteic killer suppression protein
MSALQTSADDLGAGYRWRLMRHTCLLTISVNHFVPQGLCCLYRFGEDNNPMMTIMEVTFDTAKLQKICNSGKKLRSDFGPRMADLIQQRLADLAAAETLQVMRTLPGRCHELTSNLAGHLALDLVHPNRLVFRPADNPPPTTTAGNLDWSKVRSVVVVGIGDYHG